MGQIHWKDVHEAYLLRFDDSAHKFQSFEMRTRSQAHRNDIELRHFIENMLARALAVIFASLSIWYNDFLDEFTVCGLEGTVMLENAAVSLPSYSTNAQGNVLA